MKICIPVNRDEGMRSPVCAHFGSAPFFLIVDTDTSDCLPIPNRNKHHAHGMCQPLKSLEGHAVDAVVVGGIGMGALNKLRAGGVEVFLSEYPTVSETVAAYDAGTLKTVDPRNACAGHGHGHGHGHGGGCGHGHGQGRGFVKID
jgi:predicted Fe-Mo cluster-binding NifX family protein